jgi:hypothetical protein
MKGTGRKKLWELEHCYHCAIIGTCLTLEELRKLHPKVWGTCEGRVTDYQVHVRFVAAAGEPCLASRLVQRRLDQKHREGIRGFAKARDADDLRHLWAQACTSGTVAAAYWALVTHPHVSAGLAQEAHGEVHMLSHLAGAARRADLSRVETLRRENRRQAELLNAQSRAAQKRLRERDARIRDLTFALERARLDVRVLRRQVEELANPPREREHDNCVCPKETPRGRAELVKTGEYEQATAVSGANRGKPAKGMGTAQGSCAAKHREAEVVRGVAVPCAEASALCNAAQAICCGAPDLCGRCILYVGGISKLVPRFRDLVERCGGQLIHHDGGLHGGRAQLSSLLSRADAVMCPLDRVSHDAALRLKRYCKRREKPFLMLRSAGLSSFTRALEQVAA